MIYQHAYLVVDLAEWREGNGVDKSSGRCYQLGESQSDLQKICLLVEVKAVD